ncbi:hypothetical protein [Klenkia sp. PcliD-1-E]|uniref:hypothetical protein n=1 Tax=Klenkia sp. PcliD-1-E TaxID=2954492 RepID=UPI0020969D0A|nr:hypothetical protein [Klenkia sp. PcliD-1-E]MCO7219505.1 hypothetical protein [Klenkia sp. PcliD-1-E]
MRGSVAAIAAAALIGAGLAVTPATPAAAAPAQGVYPRDLPALSSEAPADAVSADPEAAGDFAPLADAASAESSYDPDTSEVADRSEFTTTYDNTNGTQTITQSTEPMNVEDEDGNWQPIEVDLTDGDEGRAETDQHPLSPSFAEDAGDPDLLQVAVDDHTASLGLVQPADDSEVEVDGSTAEYADIAPNTDLA